MQYITIKELMGMLHISRTTAYALTRRADFPTTRIGKRVVIPEDALREWLERGGTEPREA